LSLYQQLALALGLGLLIGLEREWSAKEVAGIRTFPLITTLGTLCGAFAERWGGWLVAAGLVCVGGFMLAGTWAQARAGRPDPGMTTEVAALVMYGVGAGIAIGWAGPGLVTTGALALLLHSKRPLHAFVARIGARDLRAVLRLALIGLVILPVLPDRAWGPYGVLNPREIWGMVVLIVGISMAAYVAYKLVGGRRGALLAGLLGGLISSTAATIGFSRRSGKRPREVAAAAFMIQVASSVVFVRVLLEIAVVEPALLGQAAPPLLAVMVVMAGCAALGLRRLDSAPLALEQDEPPSDLKGALVFGGLYAAVLVGVAAAREHLGTSGLYAVAAISGLTDVDAITLSTARLVGGGQLEGAQGWRLMMVGVLSNLVFKAGAVALLGSPALLVRVALYFLPALLAGLGLVLLWP
jgi:uncharacterized membrane protein (DUF4010 family)